MHLARCLPLLALALALAAPAQAAETRHPTPKEVLDASPLADWREPVPENTFYIELPTGRVVVELAPGFAPAHVENMRKLAREHWYDGTAVVRVQDNYVTQWGMPEETPRPMKTAKDKLAPEFTVPGGVASLPFTPLPDPDAFAPEVGISDIFPAARDRQTGEAWMTHCYGIVGVGRDMAVDSGSGAELYTVIGHSPRALDRVITVVGRVLWGMEHLTALPRGTGNLGFYEKPEQRTPIKSVTLAADVPAAAREKIHVLSGQSASYGQWLEARRQRQDDFFIRPAGHIDLCNALPPVRRIPG
ncbi:peptidylprolyl isomerase [Niveispirillum sp. BGYR6]|uniref:peptidylprolyl isomerase n=1 Tax=Niveispirillum sp. BGYR6 TaxID=2971249 RepID=UPI0022B9550B|nr:peptidylprolyl isomerase [Niveispirillum sp. BGYR6]MDG5497773.1 peptidylprolyl isomerase [Niveispirillum sp. BGYR6]